MRSGKTCLVSNGPDHKGFVRLAPDILAKYHSPHLVMDRAAMRALVASRSWASPEKFDRRDRNGGSGNEDQAEEGNSRVETNSDRNWH
jgi:hypothetical protein